MKYRCKLADRLGAPQEWCAHFLCALLPHLIVAVKIYIQ